MAFFEFALLSDDTLFSYLPLSDNFRLRVSMLLGSMTAILISAPRPYDRAHALRTDTQGLPLFELYFELLDTPRHISSHIHPKTFFLVDTIRRCTRTPHFFSADGTITRKIKLPTTVNSTRFLALFL